ncbi:MAG TPA: CoA transferase, partial [Candidatus Thalassarchaeaceae archaeon]
EAFQDGQANARGAIWKLPDGSSSVANALRFMSATPASANGLVPSLDEHRDEILRDWSLE